MEGGMAHAVRLTVQGLSEKTLGGGLAPHRMLLSTTILQICVLGRNPLGAQRHGAMSCRLTWERHVIPCLATADVSFTGARTGNRVVDWVCIAVA